MKRHGEFCPTCGRPFKSVKDFPQFLVLGFERLPVPEAIRDTGRGGKFMLPAEHAFFYLRDGSYPAALQQLSPLVESVYTDVHSEGSKL